MMTAQELAVLPSLKPCEGMLSPWKQNTQIRRWLFAMSEFVPVMLLVEKAFADEEVAVSPGCYGTSRWIDIQPKDDGHARHLAGLLIRAFKSKPTIEKYEDHEGEKMRSRWHIDGTMVTIDGYKPKTCRIVEEDVFVPATEARTETKEIPAEPAKIVKRKKIICDDVEPQVEGEIVDAEVPF